MKLQILLTTLIFALVSFTANAKSFDTKNPAVEVIQMEETQAELSLTTEKNTENAEAVKCTITFEITIDNPDGSSTSVEGSVTADDCGDAVKTVKAIKEALQ